MTSPSPISPPGWSNARGRCPWWSISGRSGAGRATSSRRRWSRRSKARRQGRAGQGRCRLQPVAGGELRRSRDPRGQGLSRRTGWRRSSPARSRRPRSRPSSTASQPPPPSDWLKPATKRSLRQALELDPRHVPSATKLGRLLLARGESEGALELLEPLQGDFLAEGLVARARLDTGNGGAQSSAPAELELAFAAWDVEDRATALDRLQDALAAETDPDRRDLIRRVMVALFTELGADDPLAREHRRRLAAALH